MPEQAAQPGFREFVLGRSSALYRTAVLLTRDPHDAQDLLQDALARACTCRSGRCTSGCAAPPMSRAPRCRSRPPWPMPWARCRPGSGR